MERLDFQDWGASTDTRYEARCKFGVYIIKDRGTMIFLPDRSLKGDFYDIEWIGHIDDHTNQDQMAVCKKLCNFDYNEKLEKYPNHQMPNGEESNIEIDFMVMVGKFKSILANQGFHLDDDIGRAYKVIKGINTLNVVIEKKYAHYKGINFTERFNIYDSEWQIEILRLIDKDTDLIYGEK